MTNIYVQIAGGSVGAGLESVERTDTVPYHPMLISLNKKLPKSGPMAHQLPALLLTIGISTNKAEEHYQELLRNKRTVLESTETEVTISKVVKL